MTLSIEPGAEVKERTCGDCGRPFATVHGFLYDEGDAYGVYHALLQKEHPSIQVDLALSFGSWDEDATGDVPTRVGVRIWPDGDELKIHVNDASESTWGHSGTFGAMLDRDDVLGAPLEAEVFRATDFIVSGDPRISGHLDGP